MTKKQIENTRKWMRALLSGRYERGTGALGRMMLLDEGPHVPVGYCCLGVAASAMGVKFDPESKDNYGTFLFRFPNSLASRTDLPFGWAQHTFGEWLTSSEICFLVAKNDVAKMSFPYIAKYISETSGVPLPEIELQDTPSC